MPGVRTGNSESGASLIGLRWSGVARLAVRLMLAFVGAGVVGAAGVVPSVAAQGNQGLQAGWAIDDYGHVNFEHSAVSELPFMQQAGAAWSASTSGSAAVSRTGPARGCSTADGPNALAVYDQVVNRHDDLSPGGLLV